MFVRPNIRGTLKLDWAEYERARSVDARNIVTPAIGTLYDIDK